VDGCDRSKDTLIPAGGQGGKKLPLSNKKNDMIKETAD
jgi:hypothetical protein